VLLLYALNLQARKPVGTKAGTAPKRKADPGPSIEDINSAWELVALKSIGSKKEADPPAALPTPKTELPAVMGNPITPMDQPQALPDLLAPARFMAELDALLLRRKQVDEDALILTLLEA
jgi:hypothetical protein